MDRIAIISDIHGNVPALETTLADIKMRNISRIICLGDLVGKGPQSEKVVDICRQACEITIKGNWDDLICLETDDKNLQWHQQRLGADRLEYLASLPSMLEFKISGKKLRLFHSSQQGIYHRTEQDDLKENLLAMFDNTEFTGFSDAPDVVGYGDIHSTYIRSFHNRILFNVGSVGNPLDLPQASYAVLEGVYGSSRENSLTVQIIRLPYDIERAIQLAEVAQMPELKGYSYELRTGRHRRSSSLHSGNE